MGRGIVRSEMFTGAERADADAGRYQISRRPPDEQEAVYAFQRREQPSSLCREDVAIADRREGNR